MAVHAFIICLTFQRFIGAKPFWGPIWNSSWEQLRWARRTLGVGFALVLGTMMLNGIALILRRETIALRGLNLTLASIGMFSSSYIALHWAFRPENLFSSSFLKVISNPIGLVLPDNKKH
jgi:hypothetical protein